MRRCQSCSLIGLELIGRDTDGSPITPQSSEHLSDWSSGRPHSAARRRKLSLQSNVTGAGGVKRHQRDVSATGLGRTCTPLNGTSAAVTVRVIPDSGKSDRWSVYRSRRHHGLAPSGPRRLTVRDNNNNFNNSKSAVISSKPGSSSTSPSSPCVSSGELGTPASSPGGGITSIAQSQDRRQDPQEARTTHPAGVQPRDSCGRTIATAGNVDKSHKIRISRKKALRDNTTREQTATTTGGGEAVGKGHDSDRLLGTSGDQAPYCPGDTRLISPDTLEKCQRWIESLPRTFSGLCNVTSIPFSAS